MLTLFPPWTYYCILEQDTPLVRSVRTSVFSGCLDLLFSMKLIIFVGRSIFIQNLLSSCEQTADVYVHLFICMSLHLEHCTWYPELKWNGVFSMCLIKITESDLWVAFQTFLGFRGDWKREMKAETKKARETKTGRKNKFIETETN